MSRIVPSQVVQVIEEYFPLTKTSSNADFDIGRGSRHECIAIAEMVGQIPAELLNPPSHDKYIDLISNISILNYFLDFWKITPFSSADPAYLTGKKEKGNPISVIHDVLILCPDEAIARQTASLKFIDDINFRDNLRMDLSSIDRALSNGEWKATTVLAGSVTEALLLWAIEKKKKKDMDDITAVMSKYNINETDLNKWALDWYNKVAKELGIIQKNTYNQIDLAREFRNLIHPGREIRNKAKCSRATAFSGVAAVELVVEDLSNIYGR